MKTDSIPIYSLRYYAMKHIIENGYAPDPEKMARHYNVPPETIGAALTQLEKKNGVVLHPNSSKIWALHPFALYPSMFWVEAGENGYWGNCIWCALGIAAILNRDVVIHTRLAGKSENAMIRIKEGNIAPDKLLTHIPFPAKHWWDNVIYTCSTILTFRDKQQIADWCQAQNLNEGRILPITQMWELAKVWYGPTFSESWKGRTHEETKQLFGRTGLTGDFWDFNHRE